VEFYSITFSYVHPRSKTFVEQCNASQMYQLNSSELQNYHKLLIENDMEERSCVYFMVSSYLC